jgi:hypothetical protein
MVPDGCGFIINLFAQKDDGFDAVTVGRVVLKRRRARPGPCTTRRGVRVPGGT